jgi:hypothetical protein
MHTITAACLGDSNYQTSSTTVAVTIAKRADDLHWFSIREWRLAAQRR